MTLSNLLFALAKCGASEASVRADSEVQICVNGNWRAQNANLTDAALDDIIARALPLDEEANWRAPDGRANFNAQNYSIESNKVAGAVTIKIKRLAKASGKPLSAQAAGELKNSAFANSVAFAPVAQPTPPAPPPTAATSPASLPKSSPIAPTNAVPPPMPNAVGDWHYCDESGLQRGPVSLTQMRSLIKMTTIGAQTLVWKDGLGDWLPVSQTELNQFLPQNHAPDSHSVPPIPPSYSPPSFGKIRSNDSGVSGAILPDGLKGFNWGAFFLPMFWCFGNKLPMWGIGLLILSFVPAANIGIGIGAAIYLGSSGNQLAWENRQWTSQTDFKNVQQIWMIYGFVAFLIFAIVLAVSLNS